LERSLTFHLGLAFAVQPGSRPADRRRGVRSHGGRFVAAVAAGALLLSACGGGDDEDLEDVLSAEVTETEEPEPEPTVTEDDDAEVDDPVEEVDLEAYAPPNEIDEAYVLSVLDAMHEGFLEAMRDAVTAGEVTTELEAALADVYTDDQAPVMAEGWAIFIAAELDGQELTPLREVPDAREHVAFYPQMVSDECVVGQLVVDTLPWYDADEPREREANLVLVQAEPAPPVNPTPWRIAYDGQGGPGVEACA
jgi:hypothetical protein